jgi:hypothetical protein
MKLARLITLALASICSILTTFPTTTIAADAARVGGDLKVDGLWFSSDPSKTVIRKPSDFPAPWTILGSDIYYLTGNVGIGTMTPAAKLDINGTLKAISIEGDGSTLTNVTAVSVADGSITDAKISGTISAGKLDFSGVQKKYGKVAVVAQSGGDYTDPVTAMNGYTSWCGTPSPTNPCLLKIMPGVYNVATSPVQMQQYIDIEGSGENTTIIKGSIGGNDHTTAVVLGANNAEIRFLTVKNIGEGEYLTAIYNSIAAPKITNVTVIATGGFISHGVYNVFTSSPIMTNVNITATGVSNGIGVRNFTSSPTMTNISITASGGASGTGIYNDSFSSPVMTNVIATALGGDSYNTGVYNFSSSTIMTNVTATASGNSISNRGVENYESTSTMTNVIATASGISENRGVDNYNSSPTMTNVTATASGGTDNYGVYNFSFSPNTVKIKQSVIKGTTNTIYNNSATTILVAHSELDGGVVLNEGSITCIGAYNATYVGLNISCQ